MSTTAGDGLRADAARNRTKVIDTARKRLEEGDTELPMNAIAKLAGVGVGTVYRHFPTRQSLLEALAADGFQRLLAAAEEAAAEPDPEKAFEKLMHGAMLIELDDAGMAAVLELPADECMQTTAEIRGRIEVAALGVIARAREAGVLRSEFGPPDFRRLLGGIVHAARMEPARSPEEAAFYLDVLLTGLRAKG